MGDRLLTQEEFEESEKDIRWRNDCLALMKAQLAKADKEWIEWLETNLIKETNYGLYPRELPRYALQIWQNRKKEIGL